MPGSFLDIKATLSVCGFLRLPPKQVNRGHRAGLFQMRSARWIIDSRIQNQDIFVTSLTHTSDGKHTTTSISVYNVKKNSFQY